ncbi:MULTISPECIES: RsmB/NOP family class I SAM-dependent RNA methyltransferase [Mesorhizobium]|uniref:MFS transporter n=1 Tax=Mesorhizobium denitrificans TaxID=2294114 RepID=A0A371XC89_9HYPH|nr:MULTISPECIES: RsmB/NOP family class I SAM-dependent RNA methyltransferase [Mesorhizobium]RFC66839.1 MFS transporter [Mesorhizobium denitrificans]
MNAPRKNKPHVNTETPGLPARMAAARLLAAVVDAHTSLDGLTDHDHGHRQFLALDLRDRALVRAILNAALRFRVTIGELIAARLDRPLPANANTLQHILHVGAAQILFLDVPDSAAVDLAVDHAKSDPRTVRFAGLVNAVLREMSRRKERALPAVLARTDDAPDWLRNRLVSAYGETKTSKILAMHRLEAPFDFTVKSDAEAWAQKLGGFILPTGSVRVEKLTGPVTELPGFDEGAWWVQDTAASLPAHLLGNIADLHVADLCAAPGGKTAQLALAGAHVTATDTSRNRLRRLESNLNRLKLTATIAEADVSSWKPAEPFDAILLDAPCSSTGTVRRHPDISWTKSEADVEKLAGVQRRLLEAAIELVKPGGRIVFSNCSLDPAEGEQLAAALLSERTDIESDPVLADEFPWAVPFVTPEGWLRTTPADLDLGNPAISGMDGFFAARFKRRT